MIQSLPYGGYEFVFISLEGIFATVDDSEIGYFVDVDLVYTDFKETRFFPICPKSKKIYGIFH